MNILINGKPFKIEDDSNLITVLDKNQINNKFGIAIAVNNTVIPKTEWEKYIVKNNDNITIINAIFGG